jgi:hypothetical protein
MRDNPVVIYGRRSYWIPGSYALTLSENRHSFLRLLKNKGFKDERMTKVGLCAIGQSATLESNKSQGIMCGPYDDGKRSCAVSASAVLTGPSQGDR